MIGEGLQEPDEDSSSLVCRHFVAGWRADTDDGADVVEHARRVCEARADLCVTLVREPGEDACASLDDDLEPRCAELLDRLGREGHAMLTGSGLPRDADPHRPRNLREGFRQRGGNLTARGPSRCLLDRNGGL